MKKNIKESPLFWPAKIKNNILWVLDETQIPEKLEYIPVETISQAVNVIRQMKTRAFGQLLVTLNAFILFFENTSQMSSFAIFKRMQQTAVKLNNSRPTFPFSEVTGLVLFWGKEALEKELDLKSYVTRNIEGYLKGIRYKRLERVQKIASILESGDSVLTHCNVSGELAMAADICFQQKKDIQFFATETRPFFQGAKLTCWELQKMGMDVTLVADNAVGSLMADGLISKVIVGSDRNCANGDFANKIGTYQIAVLAKEFSIPFYVLTQPSSKIKRGADIPVEIRQEKELLVFQGKRIVPRNVRGFYPAFDIVPKKYVTESIPISVY